jgi:hypothetical protein
MMKILVALIVFGVAIAWWAPWREPTQTERVAHFERAVAAYGDDGYGKPVWLMQNTPYGPAHIAVIFGLVDDMDLCAQIAKDENRRQGLMHPRPRSMYCEPAD